MRMHIWTFLHELDHVVSKFDTDEVLGDLKELSAEGPIKAVCGGSNAIGRTLQDKLNISHSVAHRNHYKGFTITATNASKGSGARTNLFAAVPNWKISQIKSSTEFAEQFGKEDVRRGYAKSLFCTVSSMSPNGFGLSLDVNRSKDVLSEIHTFPDGRSSKILVWDTPSLERKLTKLDNCAIVSAIATKRGAAKYFHYRYVEFLAGPSVEPFFELLGDGAITIDHLISRRFGVGAAREQGPLFKMREDSRKLLFSKWARYDLLQN
jgi:hypothetical protein